MHSLVLSYLDHCKPSNFSLHVMPGLCSSELFSTIVHRAYRTCLSSCGNSNIVERCLDTHSNLVIINIKSLPCPYCGDLVEKSQSKIWREKNGTCNANVAVLDLHIYVWSWLKKDLRSLARFEKPTRDKGGMCYLYLRASINVVTNTRVPSSSYILRELLRNWCCVKKNAESRK